jgi:transcriptional regulator with XRE-family HTH domain
MDKVFCERLKTAREGRKLTQEQLALKANIPATSIAHFEIGTRKPSFDNLRKLANALEVSTDYLLGRVDREKESADVVDIQFRDSSKLTKDDLDLLKNIKKLLETRNQQDGSRL